MAANLIYLPGMQVRIAEHPQSKTVQGFEGKRGTIERILSHDVALVDFNGCVRQVLVVDLQPAQPVQIVLF
jgi:hypothetical protein